VFYDVVVVVVVVYVVEGQSECDAPSRIELEMDATMRCALDLLETH